MQQSRVATGQPASSAEGAAPFAIHVEPERRFLHLVLSGRWDDAIFDAFRLAYLHALETMAVCGGVAYSLVEARDFEVQAPEITARFAELVEATTPGPDRRTATVVPALLNKVQARAAGDILNARYFRNVDDACEWLFGGEA